MSLSHCDRIAVDLGVRPEQVLATLALLDDGATVPFIARYRKEATNGLDEVAVADIRDQAARLAELEKRREAVLKSLAQHGHLNEGLEAKVVAAETLAALEDIYLPFRPKRRTRAMAAREKGLEPLAEAIFRQTGIEPQQAAMPFVDPGKGCHSADEALAGARDIIAERINEDEEVRAALRSLFAAKAELRSWVVIGKESEGAKYMDYFEWREPAAGVPSHRMLAIRRGEREEVLNMSILPPEDAAVDMLLGRFVTSEKADGMQVASAVRDAYRRLLARAMETEARLAAKERADAEAIRVFADNLRELLLSPPLGAKRVMGVDPGFRTGCKLACLDRQGQLVHHDTIYPHGSTASSEKAAATVLALCERFRIEAVAVGNGTAGRETQAFISGLGLDPQIPVVSVSESGASVYSASEVARAEFPDLDVTVRGAISIGRRLMDPLAELVKIDAKSIGVGQYQHDVDQQALRRALDDVVASCVNSVGVDLNRASAQLLTYVSGLGPQLAKNIVDYRNAHGPFPSRAALSRVPRLGPKAFEQAAGFLRVREGENPLDASAVHPERYSIVAAMAADLNCSVPQLLADPQLRRQVELKRYVSVEVGLPTLNDIMSELEKPGRDPRRAFEPFAFAAHVTQIADLTPGMRLPGIVTNVTAFGAFVDIGVHQDGLVHISELSDRFVANPHAVLKVQQKVMVTVLNVDPVRQRIGLSMKSMPGGAAASEKAEKKPARKTPPKAAAGKNKPPRPFNNPFADALKGD